MSKFKATSSDNNIANKSDTLLFREAMAGVKPLPPGPKPPRTPPPAPSARFSAADERAALEESWLADWDAAELETGEDLVWRGPGISQSAFRKLRRGQYAVYGELDLHGMNAEQAQRAVAGWLHDAVVDGRSAVRIIHGKGNRSRRGPVLKRKLGGWLRRREEVLAYCSARAVDGGTGAVYVLLKTRR